MAIWSFLQMLKQMHKTTEKFELQKFKLKAISYEIYWADDWCNIITYWQLVFAAFVFVVGLTNQFNITRLNKYYMYKQIMNLKTKITPHLPPIKHVYLRSILWKALSLSRLLWEKYSEAHVILECTEQWPVLSPCTCTNVRHADCSSYIFTMCWQCFVTSV